MAAIRARTVVGAHPLHSDRRHAITGALFTPKAARPYTPKPPRAPKMSRKLGRAIRRGVA